MQSNQDKLEQSLKSGFIDYQNPAYTPYLPQFLVNDKKEGKKILSTLIQSLNKCEEFWFSVAFVTTSGVATLIETLIALERKGIKGKILVSQYLNFTQPEALRRLLQFKNIELRISIEEAFHSKGYLFKNEQVYDLIIGSSNLTASALCSNIEWNLKITATPVSHIIFNAIQEFTSEYEKATKVDLAFINNYEVLYNKQVDYSKRVKTELLISNQREIVPNAMQVEALENIQHLRSQGKKRTLLISATGTGKTYLSAFDVKKFKPKKFLFVVHRLNIAQAAMRAYQSIFSNAINMGVYSGNKKELEADYIFSTVQTISKEENLSQFSAAHFDYIVIDETHRAGADSYVRLLEYFKPQFLMGMTATPERTDGADIFKLFDYNIAFEIRLHRALEENILSPFHYYGVTDITINDQILEDKSEFNLLTSNERINKIIEKSKLYGTDDGKVRGLIFCSKNNESKVLSSAFNLRGIKSIALDKDSSEKERSDAINNLESESNELKYIFTVDIFNEGIDIPSVNQIIMLRPTQSAIVFVQQLGRGLRKLENKSYLTVIDFIGNYSNNFMVPIALYGDTSYNKDTLRKLMASGSSFIPGTSTINFDKISKEKIYQAIDQANMQLRRDLVNDYNLLKFKLGRIPMMMDFLNHGSRDPFLYVKYSKSYFNFVITTEESTKPRLSSVEANLLEFFSLEINNAKRFEESIILQYLINESEIKISSLRAKIEQEFDYTVSIETIESCLINLNFQFIRKEKKITRRSNEKIIIDLDLAKAIKNETFRTFLLDCTNYSIQTFRKTYQKKKFLGGLIRYNKYSRKDVCRILNWPLDISSTVYGYRTNHEMTPCFVTYYKSNDINETTNYNDHFIDQNTFAWESRSNRKLTSHEIQNVIKSKRILLFIKKEDAEGSDFYFIGDVSIIDGTVEQGKMLTGDPVVHFKYKIDHTVEDSIYTYITSKIETKEKIKLEKAKAPNSKETKPFKVLSTKDAKPYINCIPLFDIKVAAGGFSETMMHEQSEWVQLKDSFKYSDEYFVCQVVGESMNKKIKNGSWCLFRKDPGGSRNDKIVLVHHGNIQDGDFGKGYTVKFYESIKGAEGELWYHETINLKPSSLDSSYKTLTFKDEELQDLKVVGVFVKEL